MNRFWMKRLWILENEKDDNFWIALLWSPNLWQFWCFEPSDICHLFSRYFNLPIPIFALFLIRWKWFFPSRFRMYIFKMFLLLKILIALFSILYEETKFFFFFFPFYCPMPIYIPKAKFFVFLFPSIFLLYELNLKWWYFFFSKRIIAIRFRK